MNKNCNVTKNQLGNTTYYIKSSIKTNAILDFTTAIERLIKKEIERNQK